MKTESMRVDQKGNFGDYLQWMYKPKFVLAADRIGSNYRLTLEHGILGLQVSYSHYA